MVIQTFSCYRIYPLWVSLLIPLLSVGCSTPGLLPNIELAPLHGIAEVQVIEPELLALSQEMQDFLDQEVLIESHPLARMHALNRAFSAASDPPYYYDGEATLSAAESFAQRRGNCVAFANLYIALARAAGLEAFYQEVEMPPKWHETGGRFVLNKHINVLVRVSGLGYSIDISGAPLRRALAHTQISDATAKAHYYNNLAMVALIEDEVASAYAYLRLAMDYDGGQAFLWSNLGVLYSYNQQGPEAIDAYARAVALNPFEYSAMGNLAAIYAREGRAEDALRLRQRVESHRRKNPYYLLQLGQIALLEARYEEARSLLVRALARQPREYRIHLALAQTYYLLGEDAKAQQSYELAKLHAPADALDEEFDKGLPELASMALQWQEGTISPSSLNQ